MTDRRTDAQILAQAPGDLPEREQYRLQRAERLRDDIVDAHECDIKIDPRSQHRILTVPKSHAMQYAELLCEANLEALKERWADREPVKISYRGVKIDLDASDLDMLEDIEETLQALDNYPILDESLYNAMVFERIAEAMPDFVADFSRELRNHCNPDLVDAASQKTLRRLFQVAMYEAGGYTFMDGGRIPYMDPSPTELARFVAELPDYEKPAEWWAVETDRTWPHCSHAPLQQVFQFKVLAAPIVTLRTYGLTFLQH